MYVNVCMYLCIFFKSSQLARYIYIYIYICLFIIDFSFSVISIFMYYYCIPGSIDASISNLKRILLLLHMYMYIYRDGQNHHMLMILKSKSNHLNKGDLKSKSQSF